MLGLVAMAVGCLGQELPPAPPPVPSRGVKEKAVEWQPTGKYLVVCSYPDCRCTNTLAGKLRGTGGRSVPGGVMQEWSMDFKCSSCKRIFSRRMPDTFAPTIDPVPVMKPVIVPTK